MKKAVVIIYATFSIISFLAVIGISGFLLYEKYKENHTEFINRFEQIRVKALEWYTSSTSFESTMFTSGMDALLRAEERLIIISLYSPQKGLLYAIEKTQENSPSYIKNNISTDTGTVEPTWKGEPDYFRLPFNSLHVKLKFTVEPEIFIEAVYIPLKKIEVARVIKWGLFTLIVWLMLTIIIRLFVSTDSRSEVFIQPGEKYRGEPLTDTIISRDSYYDTGNDDDDFPTYIARKTKDKKGYDRERKAGEDGAYQTVQHMRIKDLFSPRTGLGWGDHLNRRLQFEINRTASANQDLVLTFIKIDNYENLSRGESIYRSIAKIILDNFPFQDLAFEHGEDSYAVILPDMELHTGIKEMELFQKKIARSMLQDQLVTVSIGLSSRNGRLLSEKTLINEAEKALEKAVEAGRNKIVAFRSDPEKYRKVLSMKMEKKK
jgi:diguanylate cyclase (GGDEF)-like protein